LLTRIQGYTLFSSEKRNTTKTRSPMFLGFEPNPFTSKNTGGSAARKNPAWDTESSFGLRQTPMDVFEPVRMALAVTPRA